MVSLKLLSLFLPSLATATTLLSDPALIAKRNTTLPTKFGILLYPGYTALDVFGPLESINIYGQAHTIDLYLIAATLDPISTNNVFTTASNSTSYFSVLPTHTFATAPQLDVLLIPGGIGEVLVDEPLQPAVDYVASIFPSLQYFLTVCSGSGLAARAGVLDGKYATTNKQVWDLTVAKGKKTKWVGKARWVIDGKIWTSSGVQAGMDLMYAFVGEVWGKEFAVSSAQGMEYLPNVDARRDPFAEVHGVSSVYDDLVMEDGRIKE
ncbi:Class I glutamine amidotransferase-like protein [Glarea lozoyensis ATCC 20868]|uniref:Class I glutamine amidotransferase-like protein n=1 Tax=Glarea lozoyensis (strain ATCC 20868 / MF5171) TaxID=1116229 RepID=S3EBS5_GLAL2|nr:Class I glutamine amidotransferase-like protein [Glarea lozoyensis ATCC 20868]EPE35753.1 Class I glutamine amidotransferase-like protein [Glarea lozoyensis ATCC 20868]